MTDTKTGVEQSAEEIGTRSTGDKDTIACKNCGVVQEAELLVTTYRYPDGTVREHHHYDRHCPVCGEHLKELPAI